MSQQSITPKADARDDGGPETAPCFEAPASARMQRRVVCRRGMHHERNAAPAIIASRSPGSMLLTNGAAAADGVILR
jgi:hypothetical protein